YFAVACLRQLAALHVFALRVFFLTVGVVVLVVIGVCSNQDCGKWVVRHECVAARVIAERSNSFAYEYMSTVLAGIGFHGNCSVL
ncbi:hypothetical protein, partial [Pseudomonas marginalis]|uniref:hypothetical protein n=1 Tax=Pseudomonas marginalis TaxID=298 RepID=UPI001F32D4BB